MKTFWEKVVGICIGLCILGAIILWSELSTRFEKSNVQKVMTEHDFLLTKAMEDRDIDAFIARIKEIDVDNCPDNFRRKWNSYRDEVNKNPLGPFGFYSFELSHDLYEIASSYGYTRQLSSPKRDEERPILIIEPLE